MTERLKTLIIEDSKPVQIIYDKGLSESVFEKCFVKDGDEALQIYDTFKPDIIVLDLMIPGMSGYMLLKEIRQERGDTKTTVIVASSLSGRDTVVDLMKLGIQGYIVKPFTHREIQYKILESYKKVNQKRAEAALAVLESERKEAPESQEERKSGD